ncbi:MAG TPA: ROK family protein [Gaiellaceae bacterium]|nr:ROK family protein [Gaiellaceae bacterium]
MRELNRSLVLDLLKQESPISRAAIAKLTALAKPTVSTIVDELVSEGLVREIGTGESRSTGGRPPVLLEFNARSHFLVGVEIGVRHTTVALADARGAELTRSELRMSPTKPVDTLRTIANEIRRLLRGAGAPLGRLGAIGIVVPGLVDASTATCLLAPNIGWRDVPVRDLLARSFARVPIFVHNTVDPANVAESLEGAAAGYSDVVILWASTGVGAGLLFNGRVFGGHGGISGELGHCYVPGATDRCACGKIGCLETIASGPSVARAAKRAIDAGRKTSLAGKRQLTSIDVAAAAAAGDALALEVLRDAGRALGIAASWLVNIVNPELVLIGGGLSEAGAPLLGPLREAVAEHALPQAYERVVDVRPTELGGDAAVRGAVLLARQQSESYYRVVFQA